MGVPFFKTQEDVQEEERKKRFCRALKDNVRYSVMSGCCGFHEIYGWERINLADIKKYKAETLRFASNELSFREDTKAQPGAFVTTLASFQVDILQPILQDAGFKLITSALNKKTSNQVHIFCKTINPIPSLKAA